MPDHAVAHADQRMRAGKPVLSAPMRVVLVIAMGFFGIAQAALLEWTDRDIKIVACV